MVKLRLTRLGRKDNPVYRVVAADARAPRDGRIIEQIGTYNVMKDDVSIDSAKALQWLNNGAQPSDTVKSLLSKQGIWKEFKQKKSKES